MDNFISTPSNNCYGISLNLRGRAETRTNFVQFLFYYIPFCISYFLQVEIDSSF